VGTPIRIICRVSLQEVGSPILQLCDSIWWES